MCEKFLDFCNGLKFVQFWLLLLKFGCHGNSLNSPENSGSIFEFTKPVKLHNTCEKFLDSLQGMEICAILAYFFVLWLL